ncbi:protein phosphatase 2C domain-containing protein [Butyrivibrio sp. AC2005]|uniref:protein phosphatase 2C domain-containing protein n=1 Tax=Butyrivibrio sp. AC2005 TaxID=1280672 RepID=UPI000419195C|nr:protein phosphatase 2C domain-containing protein [Butyrivibrio sp. AC2005]
MNNGKYAVLNSHMIGASHVAKGLACEDYSQSYLDDRIAIAVISDGHGDKNCFRSAAGAKIACQAAISTILQIKDYSELKISPDRVITEIEKNIIKKWNDLVLEDVQTNPIQDADLVGLSDDVVGMLKEGRRLQKIYGCTLIVTCILDDFWFGIQVGDGKCVCISENGLYSQPVPWDNVGCLGNRSTSICDSRAFDSFRYAYGNDIPVASFVASDGVDESFDENGLNKCYYSLSAWAKTLSEEELSTNFSQLLERISNGGSGDDVSISGIVSLQKEVKKPVATSEQVAAKMEEILDAVKEIEGRYVELRDKDTEINNDISVIEQEIKNLEKEIADKKNMISEKSIERENIRKNYISISEQYKEMIDQLEVAKNRKKQVDDYWRELGVEVTDTSAIEGYRPIEIDTREPFETKTEELPDISKELDELEQEKKTNDVRMDSQEVRQEGDIIPEKIPENMSDSQDERKIFLADKQPIESKKTEEYKKTGLFGNLFRKG